MSVTVDGYKEETDSDNNNKDVFKSEQKDEIKPEESSCTSSCSSLYPSQHETPRSN